MKEKLEITINSHFGKYNPGDRVVVDAENGLATDVYWRRKILDAKDNGCVSVKIRNTSPKPRKTIKKTSVKSTTKVEKQNTPSTGNRSQEND